MPRSTGKVFKKRKGHYNQGKGKFNIQYDACPDATPGNSSDSVNVSASERKMTNLNCSYSKDEYKGYQNIIIDINILASVLFEAVKCLECEETGLGLVLNQNNFGEAVELQIVCSLCKYKYKFFNSKKCETENGSSGIFEMNTRLVYAMRCIGKGAEAAKMFCGVMNLPPPPAKFSKYNNLLLEAARDTCDYTMKEAIREAVDENEGERDIAVAVDGTWQKRGFSSMNGVVTVTSVDTGKVLDVEILSKYCSCRNRKKHLPNCKKNFEGYSGRMEVDGALSIFRRSVPKYNVRYTKYLGDGDSKAFDAIKQEEVYGDQCSVIKLECIGHVMKRMGTRLRRLKIKMRGQKLTDGKPLSGRNRLTEVEIDRLQTYYGLAIRRNLSTVNDMRQAIWAIFLHKLSTDDSPQHGFCPSGTDSWCNFKKAELLKQPYQHKNSIPVAVMEAIRPIFKDLSNPELLRKCLHGNTQNPNESVNNVIWSRVPKKTFVQLGVLSLGTFEAVSSFNQGNVTKLQILKKLNIEPGDYMVEAMQRLDNERLIKAKYSNLQRSKEVRKEKRLKKKRENDEIKCNAENMEYGAGMF